MSHHDIETYSNMQDAMAAVADYVANGYNATAYKDSEGSYVVESWED